MDWKGQGKKYLRFLVPLAVFCWPLLFFLPLIVAMNGKFFAIGNDFKWVFYDYKVYLLDFLSAGHLPLWSPSESAGYPFYSSPFTQTFYPPNLLLALKYKLSGCYTVLDHQRFTILAISIFALGLYYWLRTFRLNTRAILAAVLIMSISYKIFDLKRFPNALHTAAWYPWMLFALTRIFLSAARWETVKYSLLFFFFSICLLTAGYPYYVYYGLFLFVPYLLIFFIPGLRDNFFGSLTVKRRRWRSLAALALSELAALLACFPYLYKSVELMRATLHRGGRSYSFATELNFSPLDTIGSFIFPPAAQSEGWYHFGILGLLLILLYCTSGSVYSTRKVNNAGVRDPDAWIYAPQVKWFLLLWFLGVSYLSYGENSYLFLLCWKYLPFFSSLRVWGRLNIILVPIFALLLAMAYQAWEKYLTAPGKKKNLKALAILTAFYAVILGGQLIIYRYHFYDAYWDTFFKFFYQSEPLYIVWGGMAFMLLFLSLLILPRSGIMRSRGYVLLLAGVVLFSAVDFYRLGISSWQAGVRRLDAPGQCRLQIRDQVNPRSFQVPRQDFGMLSPNARFNVAGSPHWYYQRYADFLAAHEYEKTEREILLGVADGRKLFFSSSLVYPSIRAFLADANRFSLPVAIARYTGDELRVSLKAPQAGYLSFIDNWDRDWEATVNGRPTQVELLFGTFKAVHLPAGPAAVTFVYRPKLFSR